MRSLLCCLALLCPAALAAQTTTLTTSRGDSVTVTLAVKVKPDTVKVPAPYPVPGPTVTVTDTLYCDAAGACTGTRPYALGKPYGTFGLFVGGWTRYAPNIEMLTGGIIATSPTVLCAQLDTLRASKRRVILAMPPTAHARYLTNGKFDVSKWLAELALFDRADVKACVAKGVEDGTVIASELMDEPNHPDWGGVPSPALLDSMSRAKKRIFPTLATGVVVQWNWSASAPPYQSVDLLISQYSYGNKGPILAYRDSAVAAARRKGVALAFSMNLLDGGTRIAGCPVPQTGGPGTYSVNCRMTPAQVVEAGKLFAGTPEACAVFMWRVDSVFMAKPENKAALAEVAVYAARQPAPPCRRP